LTDFVKALHASLTLAVVKKDIFPAARVFFGQLVCPSSCILRLWVIQWFSS